MKPKHFILPAFILLKFVLQWLLIDPAYELHRDEYLHLDQGSHLAWGYLSVPPFTAFTAFIIHALGNGIFWVKFFPALYGALTLLVVWKTVELIGGNVLAAILAATGVLLSVLLRLNTLFQPNSMDVLCWALLCYTMLQYATHYKTSWLYATSIVLAIGFLNKYNILFLAAGMGWAFITSQHRKQFLQWPTLYAALLALLLVSPNIIWQYQHHFPVVHHMQELAATQLVNVSRSQFLQSQLLFFVGALPLIIAALIALVVYKPFTPYRFMATNFVVVLAAFTYLRAKDYYAIGLYPVYLAFGAVYLVDIWQRGWKKILLVATGILPVLFFAWMWQIAFPNKSPQYILAHGEAYKKMGLLRWEDGKDHALPQDFADMQGWHALADTVSHVFNSMPHRANTIVLCDNYGETGAINFYSRPKMFTAQSFHADYVHWLQFDSTITDVILVKETKYDKDKLRLEEKPLFDTVYLAAQRIDPFAREDTISVYVLRGAKVNIAPRLQQEKDETLAKWR